MARAQGDISSRTEGSAYIDQSAERAIANSQAGLAHGAYGQLEQTKRDYFPTTCGEEGLRVWGAILGIPRHAATFATREVTFPGSNGTVVPVDHELKDDADLRYLVTNGGTVSGGSVTVTVRASTAGVASNLPDGAPLNSVTPIIGLEQEGTVTDALKDGVDVEDLERWRARILSGARSAPAGGGKGDYVTWAKEVAGVTRAWEFPNRMGVGTVSVAFVRDDDVSIIPSTSEVDEVHAHISSLMPGDVRRLYTQAPVAVPVHMTIALTPNTVPVQEAVAASLLDHFRRESNLEVAGDLSRINEAISAAAGEDSRTALSKRASPVLVGIRSRAPL
jgi:uncharacterized phage protein gp47/JayE